MNSKDNYSLIDMINPRISGDLRLIMINDQDNPINTRYKDRKEAKY